MPSLVYLFLRDKLCGFEYKGG
ncbi:protein of unknown function (plasmid) [Cupriavidus taiwanensis]|nr:protein of unknown function [Cupriavidus taiwanensis]